MIIYFWNLIVQENQTDYDRIVHQRHNNLRSKWLYENLISKEHLYMDHMMLFIVQHRKKAFSFTKSKSKSTHKHGQAKTYKAKEVQEFNQNESKYSNGSNVYQKLVIYYT